MADDGAAAPKERRKAYTMADRIEAVRLLQTNSYDAVSAMLGIPKKTLEPWPRYLTANAANIPRNKKARRIPGGGRTMSLPDTSVNSSILCIKC